MIALNQINKHVLLKFKKKKINYLRVGREPDCLLNDFLQQDDTQNHFL